MTATASQNARADAPALSWTRGAGADACPSRERVVAELERTLGAPLGRALAGRSLEVLVHRDDAGWHGTLWWRGADDSLLLTRTLDAREGSCEEFSRAIETSALVALDTSLLPEGGAPLPAPGPAPTPAPVPAPSRPTNPDVTPPVRARAGDIALGAVLAGGWVPGTAYGFQLQAEPLVYDRLRVAALVTAIGEISTPASASMVNYAAVEFGADVCGTFLRAARIFETAACASARSGVVQSFSYDAAIPTGGSHFSFAMQTALSVRITPPGPIVLGIEPAFRWNVTRYELLAADARTVLNTQSPVGATLVLRLGMRLP